MSHFLHFLESFFRSIRMLKNIHYIMQIALLSIFEGIKLIIIQQRLQYHVLTIKASLKFPQWNI